MSSSNHSNENLKIDKSKDQKLQFIGFQIPKDLATAIKIKAAREGVTMRELITTALYEIIK